MKTLSQSERQEIITVLNNVRDQKLSELNAADPGWQNRIEVRKTKVAIGRLKVEKDVLELEGLEDQIRILKQKIEATEARIQKKMPLKKRDKYDNCPMPKSLCEAVSEIASEVHDSETSKDVTGKKALAIDAEFLNAKAKLAKCSTREDVAAFKIL